MPELNEKEWFTPKELAARLDVDYWTILRALKAGDIKGTKIGSLWRVYKTEYQRIIEDAT